MRAVFPLAGLLVALPLIRTADRICGNVLRAGSDAAYPLKIHIAEAAPLATSVTAPLQ